MMSEQIRREKGFISHNPAPLTVGQLRELIAGLPDDATLRYHDYRTPEYADWYTDVLHLVAVKDDGTIELGSNADYVLDDPYPDEDDEDEQEAEATEPTAYLIGEDGLFGWQRELLAIGAPVAVPERDGVVVVDETWTVQETRAGNPEQLTASPRA